MSDLFTISEVARHLRVETTTVRRWVRQGVLEAVILPHVNERRVFRIRRSTLEQLMRSSIGGTQRPIGLSLFV